MFPISLPFLSSSEIVPIYSLARVTCEISQVLLAGCQVVFLGGISRFHPTLRLTRLKIREIILTGSKT